MTAARPPLRRARTTPRVTMTDLARAAGCSQATVSFVLNRVEGVKISEEMRARVFEAARTLGYGIAAPGRRQGAPRAEQSQSIGFLVDQLATSPESVHAIDGARQACGDDGTAILIAQTLGQPEMERRAIEAMLRSGVSGLVYMTIFTRRIAVPAALLDLPTPVVLSNCYTDDGAFPAVVPDEVRGGARATEALLAQGHRRIATITGEPWMEAAQQRLQGYRRALRAARLKFDPDLVVEGDWSPTSGYEATRKLLARAPRPTAVVCQNDKMASGCFDALREAGLQVPGDVSVVGYDDDELCRHLRPQLSSLILPHRAMGAWAVETLKGWEKRPTGRQPITTMECTFIERGSIATANSER